MTETMDRVRHYEVTKTPQGLYRTWMPATGRFVLARTFEHLVTGLQLAEWMENGSGRTWVVEVELRSVLKTFADGEAYPLLGERVDGTAAGASPAVHDLVTGIDAVAGTVLELEEQVGRHVNSGSVTCPPGYGQIEFVYRDAFTIGRNAPQFFAFRNERGHGHDMGHESTYVAGARA